MSSNSKLAVEYFANVEFDTIDDPQILQTIYNEIKVSYFTIINHKQLSHKLENLLSKSTHTQRMQFLLQIDNNICQTKLGSRIAEKIFELCEDEFTETDIEAIRVKYDKDFVEMFAQQNATFVIRKMLQEQFSDLINSNYENVILNLKKLFNEDNALITLQQYLGVAEKRQKLIKHIVLDHFHIEYLKSRRSYLFQKIVTLANVKNIDRIFERVKEDFLEICGDKYGNFVAQEIVYKDKKNVLYFYNIIRKNKDAFEKNSNIVLNLCVNLFSEHPDKACRFVKLFYLGEEADIVKCVLVRDGTIDTKMSKLVKCLFKADSKYNLNIFFYYLNNFSLKWLKQKSGRELFEENFKAKGSDKKALIGKVKKQMEQYTDERKMMQYLDIILKKHNKHF